MLGFFISCGFETYQEPAIRVSSVDDNDSLVRIMELFSACGTAAVFFLLLRESLARFRPSN